MPDRSFLHWPFFEDHHRKFAEKLRLWLENRHGEQPCRPEYVEGRPTLSRPEDAAAKHWVTALAESGFLEPALDLDVRTLCIARETLAYHDALADFAFAMQGLGSGTISLFGTKEQKETFLPRIVGGKTIAAFALSEREAGSDVAAVATSARRDGSDYLLSGEKTWISNAGIADMYVVFARTADSGAKGLSAFIVPADARGFSVQERIETISPHPLGTIRFQDCRVPETFRIGHEGDGFKLAMATLDIFRSTVGAAALGFARRAFDETVAHVRERVLFNQPLASFQLTQAKIASMATGIDASALLIYRAAYAKDKGAARVTREAAMAKWFATETASRVADDAVQLFGGRGVTRGEVVERLYRDVRALRIYEGASEIQQIVIARSAMEER